MGKKKFAFMLMGPAYHSDQHRAHFETDGKDVYIIGVTDFEEAKREAVRMADEGFGVIEVCGAFGPEKARALIEATGGRLGVGYITHFPEQDELFPAFFAPQQSDAKTV